MSELAIRVENVSKQYRIGQGQDSFKTLRDTLSNALLAPVHRVADLFRGQNARVPKVSETVWALNDISFDIKCGELVGIIGCNGAGKSTLLRILARITEPTAGSAEIRGRVGSLLEVGTGFHPELTGRENVYLNGTILGMKRSEIERKYDEIVAFSGVEKFMDTPVKHYSSGMQMRLAFAVAAHVEPEILLVDEALAVGDAAFQKKCLSKMQDVGSHGRTVLFVSHNMTAITRFCQRAILLNGGKLVEDGPAHRVVSHYLCSGVGTMAARRWTDPRTAPGNDVVRLRGVRVKTEDGATTDAVDIRLPIGIEVEYQVIKPDYTLVPHFTFFDQDDVCVLTSLDLDPAWRGRARPVGHYVSTGWIPGNFLAEGTMMIEVAMRTIEPDILHFSEANAVGFQVLDDMAGDTARGDWRNDIPGAVRPLLEWQTEFASED
ncbi:MAG TPA: polysaccharide ABC transporter ATP-binding protein [Candidatus Binatia bacterium]|jgi:lipopolysaccharide transport system ATP-binding protein|nr:polysaccharide ABC transporter ATP-binding protein [Candidatus Binatia bacterium]